MRPNHSLLTNNVYQFQCDLCDTGSYVGYTRGHLHVHVDGHKNTSSSVRKHYDKEHAGAVPDDLLSRFKVFFNTKTFTENHKQSARYKAGPH